MAKFGDGGELLKCSFCGKSQKQVKKLIAGPGVYICDECIDLCNEIIEEELSETSELQFDELPKPREIYEFLNDFIVGQDLAKKIRARLGDKFVVVSIGPAAYNRLYATMGSVNRILAWGHARAIENLLEKVPTCPRALSDQFGPEQQIQRALQQKGRKIKLEQRHKAESDIAVAAASILARSGFLTAMDKLGEKYGVKLPKGASDKVKQVAAEIAKKHGGAAFLEVAKCHFKTTDDVLGPLGKSRQSENLPAAPERKAFVPRRPAK